MDPTLKENLLKIEVCVCTGCVLHGAVKIIQSIESLQALRSELNSDTKLSSCIPIELSTNKCLGHCEQPAQFPYVRINELAFPKTSAEAIIAEIISHSP